MNQAKKRIRFSLSKIYSGLNSSEEINKVDLDVSLLKARSITVNIVGNVRVPGTYTISGFSSVLNALYLSGGPNDVGTYRNIKIIRSNNEVQEVDLYDYFSKGLYPSFYLRDQDVVFVGTVKKIIDVFEGFRINGIFELKEKETLSDLLILSGGIDIGSYKDKIFVESNNGIIKDFKQVSYVEANNYIPSDGDLISARKPNEFIENKVEIKGSVLVPGFYSLSSVKTVKDLIKSANGFTRDALKNRAILYRSNNGFSDEIISLNLELENNLNKKLNVLDVLEISSLDSLNIKELVTVSGSVKNPQEIEYKKNITLTDVLIISGGFERDADYDNITVFKNNTRNNEISKSEFFTYSVDENYNTKNPVILDPNDIVVVNKIKFQTDLDQYFIGGEVSVPGKRVITSSQLNTNDIFRNLELNKDASVLDSYFVRDSLNTPIFSDGNNNNVIIISNDSIIIPKKNNTIKITGEVNNELIIPYEKNLKFLDGIQAAGGFLNSADKNNSYIISLNKQARTRKKVLFFNSNPKLKPGDQIIVPERDEKRKASVAEILSISSGIASLVALIKIISQ